MEVHVAVNAAWLDDDAKLVGVAHATHLRVRRAFGATARIRTLARTFCASPHAAAAVHATTHAAAVGLAVAAGMCMCMCICMCMCMCVCMCMCCANV